MVSNDTTNHQVFIEQIGLKAENNMLFFTHREAYEQTLDYLGDFHADDFIAWEEALNSLP